LHLSHPKQLCSNPSCQHLIGSATCPLVQLSPQVTASATSRRAGKSRLWKHGVADLHLHSVVFLSLHVAGTNLVLIKRSAQFKDGGLPTEPASSPSLSLRVRVDTVIVLDNTDAALRSRPLLLLGQSDWVRDSTAVYPALHEQ